MTLHILARVRSGHEFSTAEAINAMLHRPDPEGDLRPLGAVAIVPRTVNDVRDKKRNLVPTEQPALHGYMFLKIREQHWHRVKSGLWLQMPNGTRKRGGVHMVDEIPEKEWRGVQRFAAEIEMDYQHRMAEIDDRQWVKEHPGPRMYLAPYNVADKLHLLGGDLEARFVKSLGTVDAPMIEAEVMLMGRAVKVTTSPDKVEKWAAE